MCTICDLRIEFATDHPWSLAVAVRTRQAIDQGLLPEPDKPPDDALADMRMRLDAIETLQSVQRRLEQTQPLSEFLTLPDFFVLLIEGRTWGFFHPTPTGFDPRCTPGPPNVLPVDPADRDAVLVTSEIAMRRIADGRLPFDKALAEGIVAVDADDMRRGRLLAAWSKAYPVAGFSRLVCA
jgi:hypothetical protein